jgi:hypothetical protein
MNWISANQRLLTHKHTKLMLSMIVGLSIALWTQWPQLSDPLRADEDLRNLYWIHKFWDSELFIEDSLINHYMLELQLGDHLWHINKLSPGYGLIFQIASYFFADPISFSMFLVFPLAIIVVFYLFHLAHRFSDKNTALALCAIFLALNLTASTNVSISGGLQRSFAIPCMLALIYYIANNRHKAALAAVFVSGLIYPPVFVLNSVVMALGSVTVKTPTDKHSIIINVDWRSLASLTVVCCLVALALLPGLRMDIVRSLSDYSVLNDPAFADSGRYPLFSAFPIFGAGGLFMSGVEGIISIVLFLLVLTIIYLLGPAKVNWLSAPLRHLLVASLLCFSLSWAAILIFSSLSLYFPSRYTQASLFLLLIVFVTINGKEAMQKAVSLLAAQRERVFSIIVPVTLLTLGILLLVPNPDLQTPLYHPQLRLVGVGMVVILLILSVLARLKQSRPITKATEPEAEAEAAYAQSRSKALAWLSAAVIMVSYLYLMRPAFFAPSHSEQRLLSYLATLPKDALIAGDPCSLDSVPLYARRKILFSCETPHYDQQLMLQALRAYYAQSAEEVYSFCQENGVDYLVVKEDTLSTQYIEAGSLFFEPLNSYLLAEIKDREIFYLRDIPDNMKLFENQKTFVMICGRVR